MSDQPETASCPWYHEDSGVVLSWSTLGDDTLTCKACGKPIEVEMEEDADCNVSMWLQQKTRSDV